MMEMLIQIKVTGKPQDLNNLLSLVNDLAADHSETDLVYLRSEMEEPIATRIEKEVAYLAWMRKADENIDWSTYKDFREQTNNSAAPGSK